ncbi:hypothetical protein ABRY23_12170 [Melioribacteraceae bacterium 4301-Me]|uniref:hypothetical protein n=1 Tax=Pyranulibacter aquaticus TaxID=3163344 RepID=UPI003598B774
MQNELSSLDINHGDYNIDVDENLILKFNSIAKKILLYEGEQSKAELIKKANKYYSLTRGYGDDEYFLEIDNAYIFWQFNSSLNKAIKDSLKLNNKAHSEDSALYGLYELFTKWTLAKDIKEREVLAKLILELTEKKRYLKNFLSLVFQSAIYTYSELYFDGVTAVELLFQAADYIQKLNLSAEQKEELSYYLQIFRGFAQYYDKQYEAASQEFEKASLNKRFALNAKFYQALAEVKLLNYDSAANLVKSLFDFEMEKINNAIKNKNLPLFRFLLEENTIRSFFKYKEFTHIIDYLEFEIKNRSEFADELYRTLKSKLVDFGNIDFTTKPDEKLLSGIIFIKNAIVDFNKADPVFSMTLKLFEDFFNEEINSIINYIEQRYESNIKEKLLIYDNEIEESTKIINQLEHEIELSKQNIKKKYESAINLYNENVNSTINFYEKKIKDLESSKQYDIAEGVKSGIIYNIFFTIIIFLVIGFATYTNYNLEAKEFREAISSVLILGLKWALVTFLIGLLFTFLSVFGNAMEKSRIKKKLQNKIDYLNKKKLSDTQQIQKEIEELEEKIVKKWKLKIVFHESRIEQLKKEKAEKEEQLRKEMDTTKQEELKPLRNLLTLYIG